MLVQLQHSLNKLHHSHISISGHLFIPHFLSNDYVVLFKLKERGTVLQ